MTDRADAGFTLLELLIAVTLLSLLTGLAFGGTQFGTLSWRRDEHRRNVDASEAAVVRVLSQSISHAYPAFASSTFADRQIAFTGLADGLALVAPLPEALAAGVLAREQFYVAEGREGRRLMMNWQLALPASNGGVLPDNTVVLASPVHAIRLAYFGPGGDGKSAWFDEWAGRNWLPGLIRVQVWRSNDSAPWLDFMVRTQTTTNTACAYDPSDINCRRLQ